MKTKAFTLIELLVVITIIGILAVGGIGVYNSQIEKARDTVRINDLKVIETAAQQSYQDAGSYPTTDAITKFELYTQTLPQDPKSGQTIGDATEGSVLDYYYIVGPSDGGVLQQAYEVSNTLENAANRTYKAANTEDGGSDKLRLELGNRNAALLLDCDFGAKTCDKGTGTTFAKKITKDASDTPTTP